MSVVKIIVDGFGGDNSPVEVLKGCIMAKDELSKNYPFEIKIKITGDEKILREEAQKNNLNLEDLEFENSTTVLPVCEDPTEILKKHSDSSMAVGLKLLASDEGDAFISAGSTGGLVVGASLLVKRLKGIKRAAIATLIPAKHGSYMLLDSGANHDCRPAMLAQFALMGSVYMNKILKIDRPKVGLVNIGTEETKGTDLQKESYSILKNLSTVNFVGNIEARELPFNVADVVVTDGFVGNVILKYTEGFAKFFMSEIKSILGKNLLTKLSSLALYDGLKNFKNNFDYTEQGGAILLGVKKPVIKAHGSSDAKAIKNAIRQAIKMVENKTIEEISSSLNLK